MFSLIEFHSLDNKQTMRREQKMSEKVLHDRRTFSLSVDNTTFDIIMCVLLLVVLNPEKMCIIENENYFCVLEIGQTFAFIRARFDSILIRVLLGTFLRLCCNVAILFLCNMLQVGRDFSVVWKVILCSLQSFRLDWTLNFYRNNLQQSGCNLDVDIPLNFRVNVNWMSVQS